MTYLQMVNSVLRRLREQEVSTINENSYSKLIAELINDVKLQVEDSYQWNALATTLTAETTVDLFSYVLVGSGNRFRVMDVINDTSNYNMQNASSKMMNQWFLNSTPATGSPYYYNFNGADDTTGDIIVDIYPVPDGVYNLRFNMYAPQAPLVLDTDRIKVPSMPVVLGTYAQAIAERGENGGLSASEAFGLYRTALSDAIAIEDALFGENDCWEAV